MVAATADARSPPQQGALTRMLSVRNVSVRFGGIVALDGVSFDVAPGQIAGLIGPNGAGKTTLFNCLSRLYVPDDGDILFEGRSILSEPRHAIPELGIGRTFQNVALFDHMSRARQRQGRLPQPHLDGLHHQRLAPAATRARGAPHHRARAGARRLHGPRSLRATARPAACRSRCASASSWRARLPATRSCCCSMSRRPASITTRSTCCAARSAACATPRTSPCCWSSTT